MTDIPDSALNVLAGLTGDGLTRLQEAEKWAAELLAEGKPDAQLALDSIRKRIESYDIIGPCSECDSWDGLSRRCDCGNRRVAWAWDETSKTWTAEAY